MTTTAVKNKTVNGVDIFELHKIIKALRNDPSLADSKFRITNQWLGGDSNRTTVGGFYASGKEQRHKRTFVFDCGEPEVLLGKDEGANPVEFLLHALAGCVTTATAMHAAARGIHIKKIETSIEGDLDIRGLLGLDEKVRPGYRQIRLSMKIESDAEGEKLDELKKLHAFSPVLDTVRQPVDVRVSIEV